MEKLPIINGNICNFAFVASNVEIPDYTEPIEITENHFFKKPNLEQIECIRYIIQGATPKYDPPALIPYETKIIKSNKDAYQAYQLDTTCWRYWIVEYKGNGSTMHYLEPLMLLLKNDLEMAGHFLFRDGKCISMQLVSADVYERFFKRNNVLFNDVILTSSVKEISQVREYYKLWENLHKDYSFIKQALTDFQQLQRVPHNSMLFTVGLFSIIECLITYMDENRPNPHSISHQITTKMILLNKEFERRIDLSNSFSSSIDEYVIWKKLYKYRSAIAHGDVPKSLNVLKDLKLKSENEHEQKEVLQIFLRETIKNLIIIGLNSPVFLYDLRKC